MDVTVDVKGRQVDDCVVLDITAENFTYPQTAILKTCVQKLLDQGARLFVLNVEAIGVIDSYGLATVVSVLKMVKESHGGLALCGLNDVFARLVELTQLGSVLEIWPSESQAVYYLSNQFKGVAKN